MIAAVTMCKDEADIVADSITRMLRQVDFVIVADNGSTDGSLDILAALQADSGGRLTVTLDEEVGYYQSRKMSALAAWAARLGAEWVIPFDVDEVWLSPHGRIGDILANADADAAVAPAEILNYYATGLDDPSLPPFKRLQWRSKEALGLPKVACRPRLAVTIEQGNHAAHYPGELAHGLLEVRHFPYRSPEQFVRKAINGAAAYAATDLPRGTGLHWREYGEAIEAGGEEAGRAWFNDAFLIEDPTADPNLVYDPCPCP